MMAVETDREMYWLWGEEWRAQPKLGKVLPEMWGGSRVEEECPFARLRRDNSVSIDRGWSIW